MAIIRRTSSARFREFSYYLTFVLSCAGIAWVASVYRIDRTLCSNWPSGKIGLICAVIYAVSLLSLSICWLGLSNMCVNRSMCGKPHLNADSSVPSVFCLYLFSMIGHWIVTLSPPFLSFDPLAYVAVGRASALYGFSVYTPLGMALPASDPVYQMIADVSPSWLAAGSAYWPGFNAMAVAVVRFTGSNLLTTLHVFQLMGVAAVALLAWLSGIAVTDLKQTGPQLEDQTEAFATQASRRAMAWVLYCPLALIEASSNAHNDIYLAIAVAGFVISVMRSRTISALASLCVGISIKASGILLLGFFVIYLVTTVIRQKLLERIRPYIRWLMFVTAIVAAMLLYIIAPWMSKYASTVSKLLGSPTDQYPYCTRSVECLPRMILHLLLKMPVLSWTVGLCFRGFSVVILFYIATRRFLSKDSMLRGATCFLFLYYLYLHAATHSWYILSLLPLLSFARSAYVPAILTWCVASLAHYLPDFVWNCTSSVHALVFSFVLQTVLVIVPPTIMMTPVFRGWRRGIQ